MREIWRKLWRGRWLITLVTIAGSLLGYAIIQQLTPRYTASSAVMLRDAAAADRRGAGGDRGVTFEPGDLCQSNLRERVEVIASRELRERSVSKDSKFTRQSRV